MVTEIASLTVSAINSAKGLRTLGFVRETLRRNMELLRHTACLFALFSFTISSGVDECSSGIDDCTRECIDTASGYFCECPPYELLDSDQFTCIPRPGPADCPNSFEPIGGSCVKLIDTPLGYLEAKSYCSSLGGDLATVWDRGIWALFKGRFSGADDYIWIGLDDNDEDGVYMNSDGTIFDQKELLSQTMPLPVGQCAAFRGSIDFHLETRMCRDKHKAICEIRRGEGFVVFSTLSAIEAQGKIYLPYKVSEVVVEFPSPINSIRATMGGSIFATDSSVRFVVQQSPDQREEDMGRVGFVIRMGATPFPGYNVIVDRA